jgi:hypothetical protein
VATQMAASSTPPDKVVHKWWVFRSICTARPKLGVSERALAVLNALLSFYPDIALTREVDLVFPSSEQLGLRAHGMCAPTSLRAPAALVGSGLIIRRDSPKRLAPGAEGEGRRDQATQAVQQHAPTDRVGAGHARGPAAQYATMPASDDLRWQRTGLADATFPIAQNHKHAERAAEGRGRASYPTSKSAERCATNFFATPYVFAQCGAYSRGRPNGQEEDDRPATKPLANRRRRRAASHPDQSQLE